MPSSFDFFNNKQKEKQTIFAQSEVLSNHSNKLVRYFRPCDCYTCSWYWSPRHCQTKEMALCAVHGPSLETLKPDGLGVNQTADVGLGWSRSPLNRCMSSAHTLRSCLRTCGSWASRLWNCIRIIITVLTPRSLPLRRLSSSALPVNKHYFVQNDPKAIHMSYFFRHAQSAVNHESSQMV